MKHNHFSTRKTTCGKIPFYYGGVFHSIEENSQGVEFFFRSFRKYNYRSQIIGNHGSGKTTFLIDFVKYIQHLGYLVNHFTLNDKQCYLPAKFWEYQNSLVTQFKNCEIDHLPIAVIDGYEQLSLGQKIWLRCSCRKKSKSGLLITTHSAVWRLPVLLHTKPTYETLHYIIGHLFRDTQEIEPPDMTLCRSLFELHQGNIRNVLLDLYDYYETTVSDGGFQE